MSKRKRRCEYFQREEIHFKNQLSSFIKTNREILALFQMDTLFNSLNQILSATDYLVKRIQDQDCFSVGGVVEALIRFSYLFYVVYKEYVNNYEMFVREIEEKMENRTDFLSPNLINLTVDSEESRKLHHKTLYTDMIDFLNVPLQRVSEYVIWANYLFSIPENNQAEISKANDFFKEILDSVFLLHQDPDEIEIIHKILRKIDIDLPLLNPRRRLLCQGSFIKKWGKQKKYRYFCFTDKFIYCEKVKLSKTLKYHNFFDINRFLTVKSRGNEVYFEYPDKLYTLEVPSEEEAELLVSSIQSLSPEEYHIEEDDYMFDILEHSSFKGFLQKKMWTATGLKLKRFFCEVKGKTIFCFNKEHHVCT
eukprot:TRINITY_DN5974_c0_g1_i1.p1 TRINITY_DN5974_c0_g1~~TRINITY_DN5974_c0_g1_i1.p1  ORF type:complete len:364 (+),score=75.63 TRINITY_DN5974_c0_g1_i1:13-1104(+)